MIVLLYIGLVIAAYLLGSISNAVWVGNCFFKIDVRKYGSNNAGATNTMRVLGWKAGLPVFILDIAKGVLAVCLILLTPLDKVSVPPDPVMSNSFVAFQIALGIAVVLGHIFPIFASFKGGKGVATMSGVILAIFPLAMLIIFIAFLITLICTRYVSLSSIVGACCLPIVVIVFFDWILGLPEPLTLEIFSVLVAVMIVVTHRKNIKRLRNGEEHKIVLKKNPSVDLFDNE